MPKARDILRVLRTAAIGLLMVSVFFGPAALGRSPALAAGWTSCGMSCPCDGDEAAQRPHDEAGERERTGAEDADHRLRRADGGSDPCEDACPYACPKCGCGLMVGLAVASLTLPSTALSWTSTRTLSPPDAAAAGTCTGIFRPPRS